MPNFALPGGAVPADIPRPLGLQITSPCAARDDDGVDEYVHAEIRRLRRLLGLPPTHPSPGMVERRRQQVRERVRRFRERRASEALLRLANR